MSNKTIILLLFITFSINSFSGEREGGAGNLYIKNFVQVAKETIVEIEKKSENNYSNMLNQALKKVTKSDSIQLVKELVDRKGRPIEENNLYAYSWPGKIQLLEDVWLGWLEDLDIARKYKADIIHELFRTIKVDMDDDYSISIVELQLGILEGEARIEEHENDLLSLLRAGAIVITGATDGTEGSFWWLSNSDDITVRKGRNITNIVKAGIKAAKNKKLVRFMKACSSAGGWANQGKCFSKGLEKINLDIYISSTMAKHVVKKMCSNARMYADGGRCLKSAVPLINDPILQDSTAGCEFLNSGDSITNCYLSGL